MPNSLANKIVVWLTLALVIVILYPVFKKIKNEITQMIKDSKGIRIK